MSDQPTLSQLADAQAFAPRHLGPSESDQQRMLSLLGLDSLDALMEAAVPGGIRASAALQLPAAASEEAPRKWRLEIMDVREEGGDALRAAMGNLLGDFSQSVADVERI